MAAAGLEPSDFAVVAVKVSARSAKVNLSFVGAILNGQIAGKRSAGHRQPCRVYIVSRRGIRRCRRIGKARYPLPIKGYAGDRNAHLIEARCPDLRVKVADFAGCNSRYVSRRQRRAGCGSTFGIDG